MNASNVAAESHQRIAVFELGRASAETLVNGEAKTFEGVERRACQRQCGNGRDLALGQLGDKRMLLENLRVAPARRPIEFGDNGRRVVAPHLINAIFVAVERKQTAIAANADAFERVENAIRRETLVRRGGSGHRAHSTCRYRAICGVRCYRFASVCIGSIMTSVASIDRIAQQWDSEIVPLLVDYVRIPAKSPHFDPAWAANGH